MGAQQFWSSACGKTAKEAFIAAREDALYDYGHRGYTGTIAEKTEFVIIPVPEGIEPTAFMDKLMDEDDPRINDKWGPAGCIQSGPEDWLFFGWASS